MLYACALRFNVTKNLKKFLVLRGTKQDLRFMYAQVAGPHIYKNYGVVFNLSLEEFGPAARMIMAVLTTWKKILNARTVHTYLPCRCRSFCIFPLSVQKGASILCLLVYVWRQQNKGKAGRRGTATTTTHACEK